MSKPSMRKPVSGTLLSHVRPELSPVRAIASRLEGASTPAVDPRQLELEQDLQLARDLQQGLMLETVPRIAGWEISAVSLPARQLGGDLYDFLNIGAHLQGIMIGDVSGKGLPAALRMAVTRTVFRAEARRLASPAVTLAAVNQTLIEEIPHGMVTMLYATVDTASGEIVFANAGHTYPVLINNDVTEVEESGIPLCVIDAETYTERRVHLDYGDTTLFYTDGIIEAISASDELFGYERLQDVLTQAKTLKPRALMARILAEVRTWTQGHMHHDDITMVLIRRRLARPIDELYSIIADVVGPLTATEIWDSLGYGQQSFTVDELADLLRPLNELISRQFGRGIAREILGQLRPVIEEYRHLLPPSTEAAGREL